ncbi:MAG: DNA repair protein RecO, partial [Cetobacterium sp.]
NMKIINSNGIVLKKNDFGEADRIITVFLEDFGRTSFVLKGIRKSKKRDLTSGEPLTFSQFSFYKKGENRILTSVDSIDFFYNIKTDITRLQIALYIISILNEILVEGEEQKKLYNIFYKSLNYINSNSVEYNNYLLLLYILHQVILIEGLEFEKIGSKFFDIKNSRIVNEYSENAINLEKDE